MFLAISTWHWVSLSVLLCVRDFIPDSSNSRMEGNQVSSQRKRKEPAQGVVTPSYPKQLSSQVRWGGVFFSTQA